MQELLQAVLEDESVRTPAAMSDAISQAAAEFSPWSTGAEQ
jgi:hypothetical protein